MATYKGFTYNAAGAAPPWSSVEEQLLKDIMATLVMGCCSEEKDTAGHKHYRLHRSGGDAVALTCDADGDVYSAEWATYSPGTITGWSGTPTSTFRRMTIGDLVFVAYSISGTGATGATAFSLPYNAAADGVVDAVGAAGYDDSGVYWLMEPRIDVSSGTATLRYSGNAVDDAGAISNDQASSGGVDPSVYGNGHTKWLCGQFWYRK
jgi:hypothetical protein